MREFLQLVQVNELVLKHSKLQKYYDRNCPKNCHWYFTSLVIIEAANRGVV